MKNLSIRNKLVLLFTIIVIMIMISVSLILPKIKNTIIDDNKEDMISNTKLVSVMTKSLFDNSIKNYLRGISETHLNTVNYFYSQYKKGIISEKEAIQKCEQLLLSHKIGKSGYITSVDISKGSKNITLAIHPKAKGKDISKFQFVQDMSNKKNGYMEFEWKNPKEKSNRLKVMYMSYFKSWQWIVNAAPYKSELYSLMDIDEFRKSISQTNLSKNGDKIFVVFDMKGELIYHPTMSGKSSLNFQDKNTGRYFARDILDDIKNSKNGEKYRGWQEFSFSSYGIDEKIMYYIYLPKYDWIVGSIVNKDKVLESYNKLLNYLGIVFIILLLAIVLLILFSTKYINNRIKYLTDAADNLSNNNYDFVLEKHSADEIGVLEDSFNNAKEKINNLTQIQQELNKNLEIRIKEEVEKNTQIQEQLFKSEKLASMGDMIGNIAHQWRQPLSVISTASTGIIMQKEYGILDETNLIDTCNKINDNAQYLSKTIDDFKNFIKGDRTKKLFSLKNDIDSFLHLVEGSIKNNNINVILDLQEDIKIDGYENELTQCLINIFNNAKDILKEKISNNEDRLIFIITSTNKNKAIIKIKDNGGGIPTDIINKVFDPYFTTKHQSKGTGLGLHMTYNLIVDGMNGTIEAHNVEFGYEDKEYAGAEFIISIPIS
ncbi:MAG: cache domain-containing protein [Campylobacterota bacterium]|nr:cache domain-containing protein [Campylobacterota bacterium]